MRDRMGRDMRPICLVLCIGVIACSTKDVPTARPDEDLTGPPSQPGSDAVPADMQEGGAASLEWNDAIRRDPMAATENTVSIEDVSIPEDWVEYRNNVFSFRAPKGLVGNAGIGDDSYVGSYRLRPRLELGFDFGMYSDQLKKSREMGSYRRQPAVVDGREGYLVWCVYGNRRDFKCPHMIGLYVPTHKELGFALQFSAMCEDQAARLLARTILLSTRFHRPAEAGRRHQPVGPAQAP